MKFMRVVIVNSMGTYVFELLTFNIMPIVNRDEANALLLVFTCNIIVLYREK